MFIATAKLKSVSRYSQSRYHATPKKDREIPIDYEKRTWRNRLHVTNDGHVFIPPMALKNSLSEAAKYLALQIPGKGKTTYTKHVEAGVLVVEPVVLPVKAADIDGEELFLPSDGKRGGGTRVLKVYPYVEEWEGTAQYMILDPIVTEDVFLRILKTAGSLIGIGRFRPRNNGYYGRFEVVSVEWKEATG